ncbi:hypothetical protein AAHC03_04668 [Spirometra sp. Aus1]
MLLVSCLVCCALSMKTPRCFDSDEDAVNYVLQKVFQCTGTSDRRCMNQFMKRATLSYFKRNLILSDQPEGYERRDRRATLAYF